MARPSSFGRDTGLQARILLTIFLLGLVYAILIAALIAAGAGAVTIAIVAAGLFALQLFTSDKIALYSMGAREVGPNDGPEARTLHAIVERLCIQANVPKPRIAIAQTPMPNAFAIGRSPKSATVCATTGILNLLSPGELEAVLGHEITHVRNRDTYLMTMATIFAGVIALVADIGFRMLLYGGGRSRKGGGAIVIVLAVVGLLLAPYAALLLKLSLSRRREFLADAGSAEILNDPEAMALALRRLELDTTTVAYADASVAHLWVESPTSRVESERRGVLALSSLFDTHPPLVERIAALEESGGFRLPEQLPPHEPFAVELGLQ
jgi:heat shock protein HtpX